MRDLWENGTLARILVLLVLIAILGISPRPHVVESGFERVRRALEFNSPSAAAENLALIAKHIPWRTDLWEQAGNYALAGNAPDAAISYFKESAALGVLSYDGYIQFGDAYRQTGNDYTAIQIWETADRIYGPSEEALTRLAETHRYMGDYPALIDDLKALIEINPMGPELADRYYELGLLLAAHQPESAPPFLLQAVELKPELEDASALAFAIQRALPKDNPAYTLMAAGQKLADLREWELAAHAFQHAAESNPAYAEAWAYLGEALQHLSPPAAEEAYAALKQALQLDPHSLPANTFMALYWQRGKNHEFTLKYLTLAAEIDPRNPAIQVDLGATAAILGNLEIAQSHYWRAVELTSREPTYLRELVEFCIRYNIDIAETALPLGREILLRDPDDPASSDVMGQVLFRLGDLLNSERFLLRALAQDPDYAPTHLHLGLLYNLRGKTSLARQHLSLAINLAPDTPTAEHAKRIIDDYFNP